LYGPAVQLLCAISRFSLSARLCVKVKKNACQQLWTEAAVCLPAASRPSLLFYTPTFRIVLSVTMINDQSSHDGSSRRPGDAVKKKKTRRYRNYCILLATFGVYMTVCTLFYTYYENWEPSIAMAFVVETMTTVGKLASKSYFLSSQPHLPRV
jgi:hypothetical protein